MIDSLSDRFSTAWLCRQQGVARSGFYDWRQQRQHNPGPRAQENAAITAQIQTVFHRHRGFYGAPRVHQELRAAGLQVGRHQVARLMRRAVLKAQTRRGFKPCRNSSGRAAGVAENLLQQDFSPPAPSICTAAVWPALRAALMAVLSGEVVVFIGEPLSGEGGVVVDGYRLGAAGGEVVVGEAEAGSGRLQAGEDVNQGGFKGISAGGIALGEGGQAPGLLAAVGRLGTQVLDHSAGGICLGGEGLLVALFQEQGGFEVLDQCGAGGLVDAVELISQKGDGCGDLLGLNAQLPEGQRRGPGVGMDGAGRAGWRGSGLELRYLRQSRRRGKGDGNSHGTSSV